jgi:hypothetical protein
MSAQPNARDLFQAAYENRYTWNSDFPGYSADVTLKQGGEAYTAQVRVNADMTVDVSGIEDETVQESLYTQMRDVVTHRKTTSFEKAHGKNSFELGETDKTGATEILVTGDAMGSNYKVRDNQICLVSRVMGRMAFVIHHKESLETEAGYLSSKYTAVFRNPQTDEVIRQVEFEDSYENVEGHHIMAHQIMRSHEQGQTSTTAIEFSNIRLLQPATV